MIAVVSTDPSYGNCVGLYHSLKKKDQVMSYFYLKDQKKMHKHIPHQLGLKDINLNAKAYFIVGTPTLVRLYKKDFNPFNGFRRKRVKVIITDSYYRKYYRDINPLLGNAKVFCMPDLAHLCDKEYKYYYHPYEHNGQIVKNERLTIAHSPFSIVKMKMKGTREIICVIYAIQKDYDIQFDLIRDVSWKKSIKRKSKAHIFIDQVTSGQGEGYLGGPGKSGIEAMAAGCFTMSSGTNKDGEIPAPPIERITTDNLESKLRYYIEHPEEREQKAMKQKEWVETYLNYEYQSNYLMS
jgi:hypothetical protein